MRENFTISFLFLLSCIYAWNIDTRSWMDITMCVPDNTFRNVVAFGGFLISVTYLIFAYQVKYKLCEYLQKITNKDFPLTLSYVFVMCATAHFIHSYSLFDEQIKVSLVPVYVLLVYVHLKLIYISKDTVNTLLTLKTKSEYVDLENRSKVLEDTILWMEKQSERASETNKKFKDGECPDVRFNDFSGYAVGSYHNIGDGVGFLVEKNNADYYQILCDMIPYLENGELKPAIVKRHKHSNILEGFKMIDGEMKDNNDNKIHLKKGDYHEYRDGVIHEPITFVKNQIRITGKKITHE